LLASLSRINCHTYEFGRVVLQFRAKIYSARDLKLLNGRGKLPALYIPLCIIRILNALTGLFARESVTFRFWQIRRVKHTLRKKSGCALIRILVDSTSMSVGKWTNQNSCRNYQMILINFFLLNSPNFLVNNTKLTSTQIV